MSMPARKTVAVVGGGAAGGLTAIALVRRDPEVRVVLIDPSPSPGRGAAYSTTHPRHVLNVPVQGMSGVADDPDHFLRWVEERYGAVDPDSYARRQWFGEYVTELLRLCGPQVTHVPEWATDVETREGDGYRVLLSGGGQLDADAVVLALGSPLGPPGWVWPELEQSPRYVGEPWNSEAVDRATQGATDVLIVGMGLTMADLTMVLTERGCRVLAVSRTGDLSRTHAPFDPLPTPAVPVGPLTAAELHAFVANVIDRAEATGHGWRAGVDCLRPISDELWGLLPVDEQRLALAHDRRRWEVRRHRLAPATAGALAGLASEGRLRLRSGTVTSATETEQGLEVTLDDGPHGESTVTVQAIIDCTGLSHSTGPRAVALIAAMVESGEVQVHPLGLGLDVDNRGRVIGADGRGRDGLLTVGGLRRGLLWETISIREIREQAAAVAEALLT